MFVNCDLKKSAKIFEVEKSATTLQKTVTSHFAGDGNLLKVVLYPKYSISANLRKYKNRLLALLFTSSAWF